MSALAQLRIGFLAGDLGQGGAERQLYYILRVLHEAKACPILFGLTRGEFWEQRIRELGIPTVWIGQRASRWYRLMRLTLEVRRHQVALVQSQHFYTNFYTSVAARLLRLPDIGAIRSNGRSELCQHGAVVGRLLLHLPRLLAANSRYALEFAQQRGIAPQRLFFLPNVVDSERLIPAPKSAPTTTLIAVGRLGREKRFDRFLSVLARVRQHSAGEVKGLIVGAGRPGQDLEPELKQQARALGLLPHGVEFRGAVADMAPVYREADICVLTSDYEGTPNVLLEAMACGLPVVATRVGGVPEIVEHQKTGFLTAVDDEASMVNALLSLVNDSPQRIAMGAQARAFIEVQHSLNRLPNVLTSLYRLAIHG